MIGPGTTIRGNLAGDEDLTVEGRIEGSVRLTRNLSVAPSAVLVAEVEARAVAVAGHITGNIQAVEAIALEAGAVVVGDIVTGRLVIEDGARYKGRITMDFEIPEAGAPAAPEPRRR